MIAGLLATGAFHEDGFADVCDGFGGGWTKEKIMLIMKDSRIGAFGAIGLLAILSSKFLLLRELSWLPAQSAHAGSAFFQHCYFILALFAVHSLSRLMPVLVIQWSVNVTDPDQSKSKPVTSSKLSPGGLLVPVFFALAPFALLSWHFLLTILPVMVICYALNAYFKKWIGGYTGDCLGAIQQVSELVFYLGFIIIWKYT